jgi:1-aminocyclopropane-1-carboxylate deaminase/D-cysteine desulfhydrase-like pyridoxal-dependent ACC family enzyme
MDIRGIASLETKLAQFPRLGLAQLPTPLEPLKRLSAFLEGPCLWVKRDDTTGLGFGGNKLRKLDYVLHEAMAARADTLVSGGVVQSNSQRQVAAAAAKLGLKCHLAVYHGRLTVSSQRPLFTAAAVLARKADWSSVRRFACRARALSASMSTASPNAFGITSQSTPRLRLTSST